MRQGLVEIGRTNTVVEPGKRGIEDIVSEIDNGYLIIGTLWFFLDRAGYPFSLIVTPQENDPFSGAAWELVQWLPPRWLGIPTIYFAVAIAFAFVVIVFI